MFFLPSKIYLNLIFSGKTKFVERWTLSKSAHTCEENQVARFPLHEPIIWTTFQETVPNSQNSENIFHRESFPKTIHASFKGNFPRKRSQVITNEQRKIVEDRWNLRQSEHQRSAVLLSYESSKLLLALFNSLLVFLAHGRVRLSHAEIKTKKEKWEKSNDGRTIYQRVQHRDAFGCSKSQSLLNPTKIGADRILFPYSSAPKQYRKRYRSKTEKKKIRKQHRTRYSIRFLNAIYKRKQFSYDTLRFRDENRM